VIRTIIKKDFLALTSSLSKQLLSTFRGKNTPKLKKAQLEHS
jgi:hypothetical protein